MRAGTPAHTYAGICLLNLRRVRAGTPAHTRKNQRPRAPAQLRNHRASSNHLRGIAAFFSGSPGAYLREATVTGAFKRTCEATREGLIDVLLHLVELSPRSPSN